MAAAPHHPSDTVVAVPPNAVTRHVLTTTKATSVMPVLATITVFIRLYLRATHASGVKFRLQVDDYLLALAVCISWSYYAVWYYASCIIGEDLYKMPPENFYKLIKPSIATTFLYQNCTLTVKLAILFFFLRAFGTTAKVRRWIYAMFVIVIAYAVVWNAITAAEWVPFALSFNGHNQAANHQRDASITSFQIALLAGGWITESMLLCFPIPLIWSLHFSTRKKLGIYAIFLLAGLTIGGSLVVFYYVVAIRGNPGAALYVAPKQELAVACEINMGIIAASLPAIRKPAGTLLKSWRNRIFPASNQEPSAGSTQNIILHDTAFKSTVENGTSVTVISV